MEMDLKILVLAGKQADDDFLRGLLGNAEVIFTHYAALSRGVRRLENTQVDLVMLMPDAADTTWSRAVRRIRDEYGGRAVVLARGESMAREAEKAGAFEVFDLDHLTSSCLPRFFKYLNKYSELESALNKDVEMFDWLEKTGRMGSWYMNFGEDAHWSKGVSRIYEDDGLVTGDFKSARQFVHPDDREIYDQANKATLEQGWPLDFEYRIITGNNNLRYLHLHRRVQRGPDGNPVRAYGMVRDVTAEREFENFLFRRDAILQVVGSFAEQFLREADWEGGIDYALQALGKAAEVTRTFIFKRSDAAVPDATVSMVYEWADSSVTQLIDLPAVKDQSFSPIFDRWRNTLLNRRVVAGNVRSFQTEEREFFERTDAKSILIVPVFVGDDWWGFIGLSEHRDEREWSPVEIESITMVADMLGAAILRSRMEDQLKDANRLAEESKTMALEASKAKSRFLANMSHEIRTPISGILGMAEMTITTGLTTEQREHMDMIRDAAKSLLSIVNDILDISKIEADKMELKPEDFEFRPLIESTVKAFMPEAKIKNIVLQHLVADDVPEFVHGDPDRLVQVLRNLIGNALKFTERGLIELRVKVEETENGSVCLGFAVRDTGQGIPKDMVDTIFESFTQADSSLHKKYQGTGLGLTIVKEFIEMMGGDVSVESEVGWGSTFSFTAWFDKSSRTVSKQVASQPVVPHGMHLNILMAEDNLLNQKFLTHFLSMFGHKVTVAENGLKALDQLRVMGRSVDLILMDIQMPEMGGVETTQVIRSSDGKDFDPAIPIIALTAYAMKGDKERMFEAGMDDYVSKPVDMKELSAAIARAVADKVEQAAKPHSVLPDHMRVQGANKTDIDIDMESLIERFDGNMELLGEILDIFLAESDQKLAKLDEALEAGDLNELGAALHSITNISSHVLAMDIVNTSRMLEKQCYHDSLENIRPGIASLRPQFVALVQIVREKAKTL